MQVDVILLILLAVGFVSGLVSGAVKQLVSLAALVLGFFVACLYYLRLGAVLCSVVPMPDFCNVTAFVLLWLIVIVAARLIGGIITSLLDGLPPVGLLNRLLGGILCAAKYGLVLGVVIWFFCSIQVITEETMQKSRLCRPLKATPELIYGYIYSNV